MKTIEIISQDVFDKIRSRFQNLEMGDENGGVTMDPRQARFFDFDFVVQENNLGRVSISINELGTLKLFYGKSILEDVDDDTQHLWFNFLREMRNFAKRRLLRFDTRDITKSNLNKDDFQYLASTGSKEENMNMNESAKFDGSSKTSYRVLERTKLIVKHKAPVNTEDLAGRTRPSNISAVYVENSEGERFKYPFVHIAGAKAMQRHVANGGRPYDEKGQHIVGMSEQIAQLTAFKRHVGKHDGMNKDVNEILEKANMKLESLRQQMHTLSGQKAYESWCETFAPTGAPMTMDTATMEDYKSKFTVSSFKEDLAQYFPLLHSIMQEAGTVDLDEYVSANENNRNDDSYDSNQESSNEFDKFENWVKNIDEGTLEPDALYELSELLKNNIPIGADGEAGIQSLEGIGIVNDALEKLIVARAAEQGGENTMLRDVVSEWLYKDDPEAAQELDLMPKNIAPVEPAMSEDSNGIAFGDKMVDPSSLEVDGVDTRDHPDYTDAYFSHAEYTDGTPLSDKELDQLTDLHGDIVNQMAHEKFYESGAEEDAVMNKTDKGHPPGSMIKQVAEMVKSFYNRNHKEQGLGPFPKGEEGVVIHIRKELGDEAGNLAEKFVAKLSQEAQESIGIGENPQHSHQYKTTMKHADKPTVQQRMAAHDIKPGIAGYRDRIDMLTDLERTGKLKKEDQAALETIMKLAGLAK